MLGGATWFRARETTVATDIHITEQAEVKTAGVRRTVAIDRVIAASGIPDQRRTPLRDS